MFINEKVGRLFYRFSVPEYLTGRQNQRQGLCGDLIIEFNKQKKGLLPPFFVVIYFQLIPTTS